MKNIGLVLLLFMLFFCQAQEDSLTKSIVNIQCIGRYSHNKLKLRWSCGNYTHWNYGNHHGYVVEKITFSQKGILLDAPIFQKWKLPPFIAKDSAECVPYILSNDYAALMAQAVFGQNMEINFSNSTMLNISKQMEDHILRFSMFSLAADKSFEAACFGNLGWVDEQASQDEKCLYKVYICADSLSEFSSDTALYYFEENQREVMPLELPLVAKAGETSVNLEWMDLPSSYVSYQIERGQSANFFERITKIPITNIQVATSNQLSYTDSFPSTSTIYYYRIIGVDIFGEETICSSTVQAKSQTRKFEQSPIVIGVEEENNNTVKIRWSYVLENQDYDYYFEIINKSSYSGKETVVERKIHKKKREFKIDLKYLYPANYFVIKVVDLQGNIVSSEPYFFQKIDSLPPLSPKNLTSKVDSGSGQFILSWSPNQEADLAGYRIYKGNNVKGEFFQQTSEVFTLNYFEDTMPLNTCQSIFYKIKAVDFRGNESLFSEVYEVKSVVLPNMEAPLFFNCFQTDESAVLHWYYSQSTPIVYHKLFVKMGVGNWQEIRLLNPKPENVQDSLVYQFPSLTTTYSFRLYAYSYNGDSVEAPFQYSVKHTKKIKPPQFYLQAQRQEKGILLYWDARETKKIKNIYIYRKDMQESIRLLAVLDNSQIGTIEKVSYFFDLHVKNNSIYQYVIRVQEVGGEWSEYSKNKEVVY